MKIRNKAVSASIWSVLERVSTQLVSFGIGIVLARLLTPRDYGVIGLTMIFLNLSNIFIDSGFGNGLIRKIDRSEKDLSTAFYFNLAVGVFCYVVLWFSAPLIASFFDEDSFVAVMRIVGANVLLGSLCIVPNAILTAKLKMKLISILNLCSQIPAGIIAIYLAYTGFGVYALALQIVFASFIKMILLFFFGKWFPKEGVSKESFRYLWNFGSKLLGANLIGTFFMEIYSVLIGKFIGKEQLGFYSKASHLNANVNSVSTGAVQKVALPILARYQGEPLVLKEKFKKMMSMVSCLWAPVTAFLCFGSYDIVKFLWTEKWIESAFLFQFLVIGAFFNPIGNVSLSLMKVVEKTGLILKLEFPKKIVYLLIILVSFGYGVKGLVIGQVFINLIGTLINVWATKRIISYGYLSQVIDLFKYVVLAFPIAFFVEKVCCFSSSFLNIATLFVLSFLGYFLILFLLKERNACYLLGKLFKRV